MALMTQSCACCWITVPQYGHRALAFTSSGAPQHSKQSKNFLQSGILSPIFFYAGYTLSIIYFSPAHVMRFVSPLSAFVCVPVGRSRSHS